MLPASGYGTSIHVGPLSALTYNQGETGGGSGFQSNPPEFAATQEGTQITSRSTPGIEDVTAIGHML